MGRKRGGIDEALKQLEQDTFAYLNYFEYKSTGEGGFLLSAEDEPECPEYYLLLRKLRMYSGRSGTTPFLEPGGYMDQPFIASLALEACISAERKFEIQVQVERERHSDRQPSP